MKKYFYLAAVSAMMLTACSSENDVVQPTTAQPTNPVAVQQQAVAFDTYLSGTTASTRSGQTGVMTTDSLQKSGFGVFASLSNNADYTSTIGPNFMYNQEVRYADPGWTYTPLKYWPNETAKDVANSDNNADSQSTPATATQLDKLSFFAYAPYVDGTSFTTTGITAMSANTVPSTTDDPKITWTYSTNPDKNVDLLWGVAPAGFSYTNVNGTTTSVPVGMPLLNLVKPDKDQKIKFLFQHALSRISLSVVSAIDQIAAGDDAGTFTNDPTTKVLIKSVTVSGTLGQTGTLNLNNTTTGPNKANWAITTGSTTFTINGATVDGSTSGSPAAGNYFLAPDLRYVDTQISAVSTPAKFADVNTGVLPSEQALLAGDADPDKKANSTASTLAFTVGKVYYKKATTDANEKGYVIATTSATNAEDAYELTGTYDAAGSKFTQVFKTVGGSKLTVSGLTPQLYTFTMTEKDASVNNIAVNAVYYTRTGSDGSYVYTWNKNTTGGAIATGTYYEISSKADLAVDAYASAQYWTGLIPRYFMVIPTGTTPITVNIKYAVVTKDTQLSGNVSNVDNDITKTVSVNLENGKSYNLKLILGLTSVKLDATVADWKVDGSTEVYLPQNTEN